MNGTVASHAADGEENEVGDEADALHIKLAYYQTRQPHDINDKIWMSIEGRVLPSGRRKNPLLIAQR